MRAFGDPHEGLPLRRRRADAAGLAHLVEEVRDADLEELVEIRRDDAEKPQPLAQRCRFALGQGQDPFVERKLGEFPVQELFGVERERGDLAAFWGNRLSDYRNGV
ncbi:mitochondrial DNA-directed RNA polymerase [Burkholderiales bacterium GJ-E10]|nr:mitochondrial DNA-directed RNA polymerase [Burkholderiales bacterium GJ-E10]